jgi:dTDP-4-amino-4,6-dideoxygalactose transaminase
MSYRIPLFDLNFDQAEEQAVLACLRSKWISTGPRTADFERTFSEMCGGAHAIALSNCTVALHLALVLTKIGAGDEVICPSLTFVATANVIRYVGATPVFADIVGPHDLTLDPADIERKITPKTKAIMVMHYAGFPCDMDAIMEIAHRHDLRIIEDACHAPFSEYKGRKLGTIGDVGCFSFFSNKNLSTGEGGMLITNNDAYLERAKLLRSHGMTSMSYQRATGHSTSYDVVEYGYNYRMDDLRAALGSAQLGKILPDLAARARVRERYLAGLSPVQGVTVPFAGHTEFTSNYIFPIVLDNADAARRDQVRDDLATAGIQTSIHYPPVHLFSTYKQFHSELPVTESLAHQLITLPMYAALSMDMVDDVCNTLSKTLNAI